jgi:hypothetical protein
MSKMSGLFVTIEEMIVKGIAHEVIAETLEVPVSWVREVERLMEQRDYGYL